MHVCCAHCAAYTVEHWRREGCEVGGFWYNPNIHPYTEFKSRLASMETLARETDLPLIIAGDYDMPEYFRRVAGHEEERCRRCFDLRLAKTAEAARCAVSCRPGSAIAISRTCSSRISTPTTQATSFRSSPP